MTKIVFYTNAFELQSVVNEIKASQDAKAVSMGFPSGCLFSEEPEFVNTGTCIRITVENVVDEANTESEENVSTK